MQGRADKTGMFRRLFITVFLRCFLPAGCCSAVYKILAPKTYPTGRRLTQSSYETLLGNHDRIARLQHYVLLRMFSLHHVFVVERQPRLLAVFYPQKINTLEISELVNARSGERLQHGHV